MLFSSVPFLYFFLPLVLLLYFLVPGKGKNLILLLASLFFYFYGEPVFTLVMFGSGLAGWVFGLVIGKTRETRAGKPVFWLAVLVTLAPLLFFKYTDFFLDNLNAFTGTNLPLLRLALPIGISFYTFQILSYLADVYRGEARVQTSPIRFLTYVTLFPQLIAGPIVRYQTVQDELEHRSHSLADFSAGITRFCVGLGKKVLVADALFGLITALNGQADRSLLSFWGSAIAYTFQIYFDFSGYSDMAIGLGRMFGFHFPDNFNHPYVSKSITEFWRRWHISLGSWFRDYVYIPLGGNRCSKSRWLLNICIVWFLTGFWHGAAWNFILWGLYFALFLLLEKLWLNKVLTPLPGWLRILLTMLVVNFGFVLFNADGMDGVLTSLRGLFGFGRLPLADAASLYQLKSHLLLLLAAAVGATPLPKKLAGRLTATRFGWIAEPVFCGVVVLLVTAYMVDGSFSPFLYFRF